MFNNDDVQIVIHKRILDDLQHTHCGVDGPKTASLSVVNCPDCIEKYEEWIKSKKESNRL